MDYQVFINATNEMAREVHKNAVEHGFYEVVPSIPERLMLTVGELAEALGGIPKRYTYTVCRATGAGP